jgi:hypothetical protein
MQPTLGTILWTLFGDRFKGESAVDCRSLSGTVYCHD